MRSERPLLTIMIFVLFWQLFRPAAPHARTWVVERDGSGDFTVIQDAVDVAASGDTVRVGVGRFDEKRVVSTPGWTDSVRIRVMQAELTIIGSGSQTIIGKASAWVSGQGLDKGIAAAEMWGNSVLRIEDLHMENMGDAVYTGYEFGVANRTEIRRCSFIGNRVDLLLIGANGAAIVEDCDLSFMASNRTHLGAWYHNSVVVKNCRFEMSPAVYGQRAVSLAGVGNASVEVCQFIEGSEGISVWSGGPAVVSDCIFDGPGISSVSLGPFANVSIDGCTFRNQNRVFYSSEREAQVAMSASVIEDVSDCSFLVTHVGSMSINGCDLARGDRGVIWVFDQPSCTQTGTIDMTDNYWGTADPDSIRAWIHDRTDTTAACYLVDFEPFRTESVPSQKKSLGDLKALFLGR